MLIQSVSTTQIYKQALFVGAITGSLTGSFLWSLFGLFLLLSELEIGQEAEKLFKTLFMIFFLLLNIPYALIIGGLVGVILGIIEATIFTFTRSTRIIKLTTATLSCLVAIALPLIDLVEEFWLHNNMKGVFLLLFQIILAFIVGNVLAIWGYTEFFRRLGVTE